MIKHLTGKELQSFKDNFKIEGYFAPTTIISVLNDQKYAICIGMKDWMPIPDLMTQLDVHQRWIKKEFTPKVGVKFSKKINSSRGGKTIYTVSYTDKWSCTCSGFKFRGKCAHVEQVKSEFKSKINA